MVTTEPGFVRLWNKRFPARIVKKPTDRSPGGIDYNNIVLPYIISRPAAELNRSARRLPDNYACRPAEFGSAYMAHPALVRNALVAVPQRRVKTVGHRMARDAQERGYSCRRRHSPIPPSWPRQFVLEGGRRFDRRQAA